MYKVMIVDDEPSVLQGMKMLIDWNALGVDEVLTAANGVIALESILKFHVDLLITDINMPEIDGIDLIRRLKEKGFDHPIIIVSGYDDFSYAKEAMRYGVKHYILKPVDEEELEEAIHECLLELAKTVNYQIDLVNAPTDPLVTEIINYVQENYMTQIRLKDLAAKFHLTSAYLGQLIKKETGELFNDYLLRLRMAAAKELLSHTRLMVYEVADRVGFTDTDYFIKKFTTYVGCSPKTYKNR